MQTVCEHSPSLCCARSEDSSVSSSSVGPKGPLLDSDGICGLASEESSRVSRLEWDVGFNDQCQHPRSMYVVEPYASKFYAISHGCGSRFDVQCPHCSRRWRNKIVRKFKRGISRMKSPKFLTLTLRYDKHNLNGSLRDRDIWPMRKILFRALRDMGYLIDSWCGAIEPPNHLHLVIDSAYIHWQTIRGLWFQITGDSYEIDIRPVEGIVDEDDRDDDSGVELYLSKYLNKSDNWSKFFPLDDLKGAHLVGSYNLGSSPNNRGAPWGECPRYVVNKAEFYRLLALSNDDLITELCGWGVFKGDGGRWCSPLKEPPSYQSKLPGAPAPKWAG